jgi:glycosyltransferase involved in cell wall biosynthesis
MNSDRSKSTIWHIGGEDVRFRIPLLLALRDRGFEVGAVGSESGEAFSDAQIPYFRYTLARGIDPLADIRTRREFFQLCSQHQPDLIHGFDTKPAMFAPIVAQQAGISGRVRTITGMGYVFSATSPLALTLRPIYRALQRQASAATGMTIFQNSDDREYFNHHQMVQADRSDLVLGSGIDLNHLLTKIPASDNLAQTRQELGLAGKLVVTMIARLVITKGVREFLQAARSICAQMPNVVFLLIGPLTSEGKQAISIEEINSYADSVRYLGSRSDIPTLLSLTDVFVLPTYYREGVPRVLLEAGAMALPLVTTDMPGCRDVVRDDWNGYLVTPRDAVSLATAILKLLRHPAQRIEMGARSKLHVAKNFSLDRVADAYADIYHRVLAQARSAVI